MQPPSPPPGTAPVPVAATASIATSLVTVTFDQALAPGGLVAGNWTGTANFTLGFQDLIPLGAVTAAGSAVTWTSQTVGPGIAPDRVSYAAGPPDVVGLVGGVPATPFVDFPLTVIP